MENSGEFEKFVDGYSTVGQHAMSLGAKAIVEGTTGSRILGDAAARGTNAILANSDPEVSSCAGVCAMAGGGSTAGLLLLVGGAPLVPAAALVAGMAAVYGGVGYAVGTLLPHRNND